VIPRWRRAVAEGRRSPQIRIWSAGCSTGEEAYSLAMTLKAELGNESSLEVELLATDLSTRVLAIAERAIYPLGRSGEIPEPYLKQFMQRGRERWRGQMRVSAELRSFVRFEQLNLHRTPFAYPGRFELIFCRNVLIYFDAASRARMVRALLESLAPGGLLVVGHAESLLTMPVPARPIIPSIYASRGGLETP
jgi:chemotaxis protein methyltransferase CheR